jgi:hypothetical protein
MRDIITQYEPQNAVWILTLSMLAVWAVAWRMGKRLRDRPGPRAESKFDDASLALLGLLLAFTFGMSLAKHDNRRDMVVADANSIGDFSTCANLLKEPIRGKLLHVIRQYAELRLKIPASRHPEIELAAALPRFRDMQAEMIELVAEAVKDRTPIDALLVNGLNRVTSSHVSRLAAVRDRLPTEIVVLLSVSALVSTLLVGREQGIAGRAEVAGTLGFILLVALTIYVTLDLNQPQRGSITVSQDPIRELLSTMPRQ